MTDFFIFTYFIKQNNFPHDLNSHFMKHKALCIIKRGNLLNHDNPSWNSTLELMAHCQSVSLNDWDTFLFLLQIKVAVSADRDCIRAYQPQISSTNYNILTLNVKTSEPDNLLFYLGSSTSVSTDPQKATTSLLWASIYSELALFWWKKNKALVKSLILLRNLTFCGTGSVRLKMNKLQSCIPVRRKVTFRKQRCLPLLS